MEKVKLVIGNKDPLFKVEDLEKLQGKRVDKDIYVADNQKYMDNFKADKAKYMKVIKTFLEEK